MIWDKLKFSQFFVRLFKENNKRFNKYQGIFSDMYDSREVLLKVVLEYDRVDEQGEMVHVKGTYVDKEKLGEVDVEITELSGNTDTYIPPEPEPEPEPDGGGEESNDNEAADNGGNEDDPEGHHSGKITDGGGKGSGTTDVYLQVITFEMCFDLKKEPIEMQNQAFCDYSMMGYVFVFSNRFETYRIPCNEFNYLTDDETCALLRFTVRWTHKYFYKGLKVSLLQILVKA